jgi:preprotein translocase subunit SecD
MPRSAPTPSLLARALVALCLLGTTAVAQPLTLEIARAAADFDQRTKEPIVRIWLTKESGIAFGKFTADRVGEPMEMRRDGQVVSRSVLREPLLAGSFQISGGFSVDQTTDIAGRLPAGAIIEVEIAAR